LGGFVLQVVPAIYVKEAHLFQPMHKEVVFNAKLRHTDGLLHERYMQSFGVSYQRANRMLEEDVAIITEELRKGLTVSLGAVGSLSLGEEGQVIFKTGNTETFSVDSYGLVPIHLKTWESMQEENTHPQTPKEKKNTFYIPVNRRVLRIVTATAVAIALFFLISTPVKEINRDGYKAGFIPAMPSGHSSSTSGKGGFTSEENEIVPEDFGAIIEEEEVVTDSIKEKSPRPQPEFTPPKPQVKPVQREFKAETETYYIIIASVSSRKQADEFIAYNVDFGTTPNAGTIASGAQIRVYADKFTDKSQAETFLAKTRNKFPAAWMFTEKK
jgi:hypothetical protein